MEITTIILVYMSFALFVMLINAIIAGYNGKDVNIDDIIQSVLWPISLASLVGVLIRLGVEIYKESVQNKAKQQKPQAQPKKETK